MAGQKPGFHINFASLKPRFLGETGLFWLSSILSTMLCLTIPFSPVLAQPNSSESNQQNCPEPAASRIKIHLVAPGETVESIANLYNLIPATLMGMNPSIRQGTVQAGTEIFIPPFNGIMVEVPENQTWRDVAAAFKLREILVYEANGCQENPRIVFLPGVNWSPGGLIENVVEDSDIKGYPLPTPAPIALGYGWLLHPTTHKVFFHSGIDLMANPGTPVLAVGDGVVAFAGQRGDYGNLVVINHQRGQQSRYAHLEGITVTTGQTVRQGELIGTVGETGNPDTETAHLHFEVRYNSDLGWVAQDPKSYFKQNIGTGENIPDPTNPNNSPLTIPGTGQQPQANPIIIPMPTPNAGQSSSGDKPAVIPVPPGTGRLPLQPEKPLVIPAPSPGRWMVSPGGS